MGVQIGSATPRRTEVETEGAVLTVASRIDFLVIDLQVVDGIGQKF